MVKDIVSISNYVWHVNKFDPYYLNLLRHSPIGPSRCFPQCFEQCGGFFRSISLASVGTPLAYEPNKPILILHCLSAYHFTKCM